MVWEADMGMGTKGRRAPRRGGGQAEGLIQLAWVKSARRVTDDRVFPAAHTNGVL